MTRLPRDLYEQDPVTVARELLGTLLIHQHPGKGELIGRIVETEAYRGEEDQACHAKSGPTKRNAPLYGPPGLSYVYLIYGMYHMFNAVTWPDGTPAAVLIRGVERAGTAARPRLLHVGEVAPALGQDDGSRSSAAC